MSKFVNKYAYERRVWHTREARPEGSDGKQLQIKIRAYVKKGWRFQFDPPCPPDEYTTPRLLMTGLFKPSSRERLLSYRSDYTEILGEFFEKAMGELDHCYRPMPEEEQRSIIRELFRVAKDEIVASSSSSSSISVIHLDVTVVIVVLTIPAAADALDNEISTIKGVEKVRLDDDDGFLKLELAEAIITNMPSCVVCMEKLIDGIGKKQHRSRKLKGTIAKKPRRPTRPPPRRVIVRLSCSHYFHGDCILQWLQKMHVCPLCRYIPSRCS